MSRNVTAFALHAQLATDCAVVGDLPLCRVLLMNDWNYPWCILVPRRTGLREIYELSEADLATFWRESAMLGRLLMRQFQGEKLNVAALGNQVPQLHVHHIVRYARDAAWPRPVWGAVAAKAYPPEQLDARLQELRTSLEGAGLLPVETPDGTASPRQ